MGNLEFQFPAWYIILCLALGLLYAGAMYFRSTQLPDSSGRMKWLLGTLRLLSISLLSMLLLSPILKSVKSDEKKPIIIFTQDQSTSVKGEMDSIRLETYVSDFKDVMNRLGQDFEVKSYGFGESIREPADFEFKDKSSNCSSILEYIGDLYGDQNLGAVIYATDGIFNEGRDPTYSNFSFSAPVYTVALGDTTQEKDLFIRQIYHNNIAYLGDRTTVQVDVSAYNCNGQSTSMKVYRVQNGGTKLEYSESFRMGNDDFFQTFEFNLELDKSGIQRFRVILDGLGGENSYVNNRKDFFIDVIDARQKILILAAYPHPDIAAMKAILENNKNYDVTTALAKTFTDPVKSYDFIILHQLPAKRFSSMPVLRQINEEKIPRMVIVGSQTNLAALNQFQGLVKITPKGSSSTIVEGIVNQNFTPFTISNELRLELPQFAPIDAPFAEYEVSPGAEILLKQRIGKIDTEFPLWVFGEDNGSRTSILCAEGLWRWRLYDFLQHEQHDIFNELISKAVQYNSLKEDKRRFRVFQANNLYAENEDTRFDAEFYNLSFEKISDPEVTITIYNSEKEAFNYAFSRRNNGYILNAGKLPVGDYSWTATTQYEGERFTAQGQFSVQAIEKESYASVANHQLLSQIAQSNRGQMVYPDQVSQLADLIKENPALKPVYYQIVSRKNAIHLKWIFFGLFLLLGLEWALRRYFGTY